MPDENTYLHDIADKLDAIADQVDELDLHHVEPELLALIGEAVSYEESLRQQCQLGVRFSVIASQLQKLFADAEQALSESQQTMSTNKSADTTQEVGEDEAIVYVYLFNVQGRQLASWERFLSHTALVEHSVNRPIYSKKEHVEQLLRAKNNTNAHAYIEVVIKSADILKSDESSTDIFGSPILRLKQGALKPERIVSFVCEGKIYRLKRDGHLEIV